MAGNPKIAEAGKATRFSAENQPENRGRKTGSRDRLSSRFFEDLNEIWQRKGMAALEALNGDQLSKLVGAQTPKQVEERKDPVGDMADERLDELIEMANAERQRRQSTVQ